MPIMAILCDGKTFTFYKFVDKRPAKAFPELFVGEFPSGMREVTIVLGSDIDRHAFYQQLRRACATLYYVFLTGYLAGLETYWKRSVEEGKAEGKKRDSTPGWYKAKVDAKRALREAVSAWNLYEEGKVEESNRSRERAAQLLAERYVSRCLSCVVVNHYGHRGLH